MRVTEEGRATQSTKVVASMVLIWHLGSGRFLKSHWCSFCATKNQIDLPSGGKGQLAKATVCFLLFLYWASARQESTLENGLPHSLYPSRKDTQKLWILYFCSKYFIHVVIFLVPPKVIIIIVLTLKIIFTFIMCEGACVSLSTCGDQKANCGHES